jgi:hypothetical protein
MSVPQSIIDSAKAVESWLEEQNAGITYVVFPGSGKGYQEMDVWSAQADRVFRDWGGMPRLNSILAEDMIS